MKASIKRVRARRRGLIVVSIVAAVALIIVPFVSPPHVNAAISVRGGVTANNASATTLVFSSLPSGWQQDDVFVAIFSIYNNAATVSSISGTAGWTLVPTNNTVSASNMKSFMYYKVATASESAPTVTFSASAKAGGVIVAYSGVDTSTPFAGTATPKATTTASTTMTTNAIASSMPAGGVVVAAFGGYNTSSNTTATFTKVNGASPTITMTLEGNSGGTQLKNNPMTITGIEDGTLASASTLPSQSMTSTQTMVSTGFLQVLKPYVAPTLTQSVYRWYGNADSTSPSGALANENATASVVVGTPVRLRLQVDVSTAALGASSQAFQLEYSTSTSGPWVTTFGWYNNPTPSDGATLGSSLLTGTDVVQTYQESNPTASNPNAVSSGQQTEWDFSIDTTGIALGTYYFRLAKNGGTAIDVYTVYPTLTLTAPTLDQQLRGGGSVVNGTKGALIW